MYECICEVIADAPQSIESSALRNTFYSKNEYVCMYVYLRQILPQQPSLAREESGVWSYFLHSAIIALIS